MAHDMKVEVERSLIGDRLWFFRIRWANGRIATTSELYTRLETAVELGQKMADRLDCMFVIKE
jgi:uncharacterized protein YegP (UPF0339 family)